jgi:tellurite resistance protein TerC
VDQALLWIAFNVFVAAALAVDLGVVHRRGQALGLRQALAWSALWILLALLFAALLYMGQGRQASLEFATGYIIELSLSADNLFIFLLIFRYFQLPEAEQHRVLFWGILGAITLRLGFIFAGVGLLRRFHWFIYAFGLLLLYSGLKLVIHGQTRLEPQKQLWVRVLRRLVPTVDDYPPGSFFVRRGRLMATPLFLVLLAIETTDLVFALDSIPAVLSITLNTFIVYSSNVFAILGLRSLFFALRPLMDVFEYLHYGISCVLIFVGLKMLTSRYYPIRTETSLAVIGGILLVTILASALHREKP